MNNSKIINKIGERDLIQLELMPNLFIRALPEPEQHGQQELPGEELQFGRVRRLGGGPGQKQNQQLQQRPPDHDAEYHGRVLE